MYRKPTPKRQAAHARKLEALRRGRDRANASKPPRLYPPTLPDLRRVVTFGSERGAMSEYLSTAQIAERYGVSAS